MTSPATEQTKRRIPLRALVITAVIVLVFFPHAREAFFNVFGFAIGFTIGACLMVTLLAMSSVRR